MAAFEHDIHFGNWYNLPAHRAGAKRMSRVIKMSTPKGKAASLAQDGGADQGAG